MSRAAPATCPFCEQPYHQPTTCPRVSAVEFFYRSQRVKRVELRPPQPVHSGASAG